MLISFLGTAAAEGIPALFCNCKFCREARAKGEIRTRAQIIIDGELSIDFPPDAFIHAARGIDFSAIRYLLVTHSHMDHFNAHDFVLRGYKYAHNLTEPVLHIYGNSEVAAVFSESTSREMKPSVASNLRFHTVHAFETISFGDWRVHTMFARHSSEEPLLFLIEKGGKRILHLADTGVLPDKTFDYLKSLGEGPADLIIFDCTLLHDIVAPLSRHMGLADNIKVFNRLVKMGIADANTKKVITHFSHNSEPSAENLRRAEEAFGAVAAFDGMIIEI